VTLTAVPATPIDGVKLVIVGAATDATVNVVALVVDHQVQELPIVPVVAPLGKSSTGWPSAGMVAVVTLNVTVSRRWWTKISPRSDLCRPDRSRRKRHDRNLAGRVAGDGEHVPTAS
jgi:hypothetical protein